MAKSKFIYDLDELPPIRYAVLYGLQWAIILFPTLIIIAALGSKALGMDEVQSVRFFQLILLTSGFFTALQSLIGHRYPLLEGPAAALILTFIVLAPYGIEAIQGGTILGGGLLAAIVVLGKLKKVMTLTTPNVVGVILMLIALSLLPHLTRFLTGADEAHPHGNPMSFFLSMGLVGLMATLSYWLKGFWKTIALLLGMLLGSLVFAWITPLEWHSVWAAQWFSLPSPLVGSFPQFYWPAVLAFASSYVAVVVNSLGSLHGIANVTDTERLPRAISRGILMNGIEGICCGLLGIVGMVSYSISPGVVLANRVATRYATVSCGAIMILAAFMPKLAALLGVVPAPVVGAALGVAMGAQVGAAVAIVSSSSAMTGRDYFVVGIPVLLGTLVGFLPQPFMESVPTGIRVFVGNGLILGIALVLVLEHVLLRQGDEKQ